MKNNEEQSSLGHDPLQRRRSRLSGKGVAFGLVMAFLLTGILLPAVVRLPAWIDYEIVLLAWWGIWLAALTTLLYQGKRVADDHRLSQPRNWLDWAVKPKPESKPAKENPSPSGGSNWGIPSWFSDDGEGCLWVLGAIVAAIVLFFALWFLIEVAIPLLLFLLYLVPRGMLSHVVNDRHHCKGRLGRALGWAFFWATLYTLPLAGLVWFVHFLSARAA